MITQDHSGSKSLGVLMVYKGVTDHCILTRNEKVNGSIPLGGSTQNRLSHKGYHRLDYLTTRRLVDPLALFLAL